jgi:hypothetical protein
MPGGGIVAKPLDITPARLDSSVAIGYKPAEPGYMQVITLGVYDETYRAYRLRKIAP